MPSLFSRLITPLALLLVTSMSLPGQTNPWTHIAGGLTKSELTGCAVANGIAIAVTADGYVIRSENAAKWTITQLDGASQLRALVFFQGKFLASGIHKTDMEAAIFSSIDGVAWERVALPHISDSVYTYYDTLCVGGGSLVAAGNSTKLPLVTSADGVRWTIHSDRKYQLSRIVYGSGYFYGINPDDAGAVYKSSNGVDWARLPFSATNLAYGSVKDLSTGNGILVAVGYFPNGKLLAMSSDGGATWITQTAPILLEKYSTYGTVDFANGKFYLSGVLTYVSNVAAPVPLCSSENGLDWQICTKDTPNALRRFTFGDGEVLAVGGKGTICTSSDGLTWVTSETATAAFRDLLHAAGQYVAVGGKIATSTDGLTWTDRKSDVNLVAVTQGNGRWVAVGRNMTTGICVAETSVDGTNWTSADIGFFPSSSSYGSSSVVIITVPGGGFSGGQIYDVTYGNGQFVAVGEAGGVFTSPDGLSWTLRDNNYFLTFTNIAWTGERFVIVARSTSDYVTRKLTSSVLVSSDGAAWSIPGRLQDSGFDESNRLAVSLDGVLVALGESKVFRSVNGLAWTETADLNVAPDYDMAIGMGNGQFVTLPPPGYSGYTAAPLRTSFSTDGNAWVWTENYPPATSSVAGAEGAFVAVGESGCIYRSELSAPPSPALLLKPPTLRATFGRHFSQVLSGAFVRPALTVTHLPAGFSFNRGTNTIAGTPRTTLGGQYIVTASMDGYTHSKLGDFIIVPGKRPFKAPKFNDLDFKTQSFRLQRLNQSDLQLLSIEGPLEMNEDGRAQMTGLGQVTLRLRQPGDERYVSVDGSVTFAIRDRTPPTLTAMTLLNGDSIFGTAEDNYLIKEIRYRTSSRKTFRPIRLPRKRNPGEQIQWKIKKPSAEKQKWVEFQAIDQANRRSRVVRVPVTEQSILLE